VTEDETRQPEPPAAAPENPAAPTAAESWRRTTEILDLVSEIREARRRRLESEQPHPAR
jgi:hypothetical protein